MITRSAHSNWLHCAKCNQSLGGIISQTELVRDAVMRGWKITPRVLCPKCAKGDRR